MKRQPKKEQTASKNIYTLNDSVQQLIARKEVSSQDEYQSSTKSDSRLQQKEIHKLVKINEELARDLNEVTLKNQQLSEVKEITDQRNDKHEQRQRDLIKKLSYFQVNNKQLTHQIRKLSEEILQVTQNKKLGENQAQEIRHAYRKFLVDRDRFTNFLKDIFQLIAKSNSAHEFAADKNSILNMLGKNIQRSEQPQTVSPQFDFKFEFGRLQTLKQKNKQLESELEKMREELAKQKEKKKTVIMSYNEKVAKLKESYDFLKIKVEEQEEDNSRKLRNVIIEKNQLIDTLKSKMRENRSRKQSFDNKKSIDNKSFIGDGENDRLQISQLDQEIQKLQRQILNQFDD